MQIDDKSRAKVAYRHFSIYTFTTLIIVAMAAAMGQSYISLGDIASQCLDGDGTIFGYILAWGSHAIFHSPLQFYNPPIFFPDRYMLPGTDGLELPALLISPVWYLFHNPVLLMNLTLLIAHGFCVWAGYISARAVLRLPRCYALMVGFFFGVSSDHFWHSAGHLNLVWAGILPLIFTCTWLLLETP